MKWHHNPVTIFLHDKEDSISNIPFPTVTICPETKTYKDKLDFVSLFELMMSDIDLSLSEIE